MKNASAALHPLTLVSLLSVVGTFALLALGRQIPGLVETLDTVSLSALAGVSLPGLPSPAGVSGTAPTSTAAAAPVAPVSGPVGL